MTWSYSGDPSSSPKDAYRFKIGDTDATSPVLQDEEIEFVISNTGTENGALAALYEAMASHFGKAALKRSLGPQSEDNTKRLEFFLERAQYYRKLASASSGLSQPKSTPTIFWKGMNDNVRVH